MDKTQEGMEIKKKIGTYHVLTSDWLHDGFPGVLVRNRDRWSSIVSVVRLLLTENNGG